MNLNNIFFFFLSLRFEAGHANITVFAINGERLGEGRLELWYYPLSMSFHWSNGWPYRNSDQLRNLSKDSSFNYRCAE